MTLLRKPEVAELLGFSDLGTTLHETHHRLPLQAQGLDAELEGLLGEGFQITPPVIAIHDLG